MTNHDRLIAKVKKLLTMAKHDASNENEAATALRQAEALMRKHSIEFSDIESLKEGGDMLQALSNETRNSKWVWQMAWSAANLTSTLPNKTYSAQGRQSICFCGLKEDTEVALLMFDYLVGVGERMSKEFKRDRRGMGLSTSTKETNSFKLGLSIGLFSRTKAVKQEREAEFRDAAPTGKDVVLVKESAIKSEFGLAYHASRTRVSSNSGYASGRKASNNVSLHQQVGRSSQARLR